MTLCAPFNKVCYSQCHKFDLNNFYFSQQRCYCRSIISISESTFLCIQYTDRWLEDLSFMIPGGIKRQFTISRTVGTLVMGENHSYTNNSVFESELSNESEL